MSYVIELKMDREKREQFNEQVTYVSTKIILGAYYVPIILLIGTIFQVAVLHMNLGMAVCRFIAYSSLIGIVIMTADVIDNWLSLKWEDIELVDKKRELGKMIRNSIVQIGIWVGNFIIFGVILMR